MYLTDLKNQGFTRVMWPEIKVFYPVRRLQMHSWKLFVIVEDFTQMKADILCKSFTCLNGYYSSTA